MKRIWILQPSVSYVSLRATATAECPGTLNAGISPTLPQPATLWCNIYAFR
ncbi:hypothetical protein SGGMMB4_05338 [Sodalis glossinidius str. 'morsitans']|uniref:Uncharacterized protein n=1 Tax=Sodalis glossinidius (strain morsitans) TaxID=343509 RepID=A0A193QN99_SODGM|nr:hypothetical protein SGGMMB4_05338 [Sodalis glossinidius str. 'morsitans']